MLLPMQGNPNVDTHFNTVRAPENCVVTVERTVSQQVDEESFVQMAKDQRKSLQNIENKIQEMESQMETILDEKNKEMGVLHAVIENEEFDGDVQLEEDSIDPDSIQQYQQLKKLNEQLKQQRNQYATVKKQLDGWIGVAEEIVEERENLTLEPAGSEEDKEIETGGE